MPSAERRRSRRALAGPLALIGGAEWQPGCEFDVELLKASGGSEVLVVPAAAAFEHPERSVERAVTWFSALEVKVTALPVFRRAEADDPAAAAKVREARFIYLADGSALHLRSVLKGSLVWEALGDAWRAGAVVAGSAAGATILGDPMVDPRGGTFTLGLGLVRKLALVPHWESWTDYKARRMAHLIPSATVVAEVEERTALIRWPDGTWQATGAGKVDLSMDHEPLASNEVESMVDLSEVAAG